MICAATMSAFRKSRRPFEIFGGLVTLLVFFASMNSSADEPNVLSEPTPQWTFGDGATLAPILSYDLIRTNFSGEHGRLANAEKGTFNHVGLYVSKPGTYEISIYYSLLNRQWRDAFVKMQTSAYTSYDFGSLRLGEGKIPLDFEKNTSSTQTSFIEYSTASQAVFESYRIGVQWSWHREHALIDAGYYGDNLEGSNPGHTWALHGAWVPINLPGDVLHLGLARSVEYPEGRTDESGVAGPATASFKAAPSVMLEDVSLESSGTLENVKSIQRTSLEGLWIDGPVSCQAEYLGARTAFSTSNPNYDIHGRYAFASWVLTGESRRYDDGVVQNVIPEHASGAVELVLRYSSVNLNDWPVPGGWERDWTAGVNWYYGRHLRLQANYTRTQADRRHLFLDPATFEMRLELFM
ncbi:porin [Dyella dinghuensis]|uniref:Porin n=1 Tax=Dyella dinghuensis TaxID=1920169 RepID=A0A3S0RF54_9GAMM|nr:porin [Dyella dinghuensis]